MFLQMHMSVELKVTWETWVKLVLAIVASGVLFVLIMSLIMPLFWSFFGAGVD
jgi:hypothetical protein